MGRGITWIRGWVMSLIPRRNTLRICSVIYLPYSHMHKASNLMIPTEATLFFVMKRDNINPVMRDSWLVFQMSFFFAFKNYVLPKASRINSMLLTDTGGNETTIPIEMCLSNYFDYSKLADKWHLIHAQRLDICARWLSLIWKHTNTKLAHNLT